MIAIVISTFNKPVTDGLLEGCLKSLNQNGYENKKIEIFHVPGAFELPAKVKHLVLSDKYISVIALGCIIKGETDHYHYISQSVTNGIMSITLEFANKSSSIFFGVLTCQTKELAIARSSHNLKNNKGYEIGLAAVNYINNYNKS